MVKANSGFTAIELLIGIAILSVLVGIAVPNFQSMLNETRQTTLYNKLAGSLRFARSEAVKRSVPVSVCPRASQDSCGDDWSAGVLVFVDSARNGEILVYDGADVTLRSEALTSPDISITARALIDSAGAVELTDVIRFNGRGQPNWFNGTMVLCDTRGKKYAKALIMTGSGISRKAYSTETSNDVVVDALGEPVSCPL